MSQHPQIFTGFDQSQSKIPFSISQTEKENPYGAIYMASHLHYLRWPKSTNNNYIKGHVQSLSQRLRSP